MGLLKPGVDPGREDADSGRPTHAAGSRARSGPIPPRSARQKAAGKGGRTQRLKIATFNINNINKRLANLLAWLAEATPDVVCLQELKAADNQFPARAIRDAGYHAVWCGE